LGSKKRSVLLSPAAPAVIGLDLLAYANDAAAKFGAPGRRRTNPSGKSGFKLATID
jgi:hypothetical protein